MKNKPRPKIYIAVHDEVPDNMVPVLVSHAVLGAHLKRSSNNEYLKWLAQSFRKVIVRVEANEFNQCALLPDCHIAFESTVMHAAPSCVVSMPYTSPDIPEVLRNASLWDVAKQPKV